jgi:hypothetical protein
MNVDPSDRKDDGHPTAIAAASAVRREMRALLARHLRERHSRARLAGTSWRTHVRSSKVKGVSLMSRPPGVPE